MRHIQQPTRRHILNVLDAAGTSSYYIPTVAHPDAEGEQLKEYNSSETIAKFLAFCGHRENLFRRTSVRPGQESFAKRRLLSKIYLEGSR